MASGTVEQILNATGGDNAAVDVTIDVSKLDPMAVMVANVNVPTGNTGILQLIADDGLPSQFNILNTIPTGPIVYTVVFGIGGPNEQGQKEGMIFFSHQVDTSPAMNVIERMVGRPRNLRFNMQVPGAAGRRWRYSLFAERAM